MDMGIVRGLITLVLFLLFIGLVAWTWSRRRKKDFDEAARLPLDDDKKPPSVTNSEERSQ
jgi:cytochrome c oxidase cbb3-type subunit 4